MNYPGVYEFLFSALGALVTFLVHRYGWKLPTTLDKDGDGVPDVLEKDDHDGPEPTEPKES